MFVLVLLINNFGKTKNIDKKIKIIMAISAIISIMWYPFLDRNYIAATKDFKDGFCLGLFHPMPNCTRPDT